MPKTSNNLNFFLPLCFIAKVFEQKLKKKVNKSENNDLWKIQEVVRSQTYKKQLKAAQNEEIQ